MIFVADNNNLQQIMEEYHQLFLLFYRKVAIFHPRKINLLHRIHNIFAKIKSKVQNDNRLSHQNNEEIIINHNITFKRLEEYWNCNWIYTSKSFREALFFAVLYQIIQNDDYITFSVLDDKFNESVLKNIKDRFQLQMIYNSWRKIIQLFKNHNNFSNWQNLLSKQIKNNKTVLYLIFSTIQRDQNDNTAIMIQTSQLYKVKIQYFDLQTRKNPVSLKFGISQRFINVCFLEDLHEYVISNEQPRKSLENKRKQQNFQLIKLGLQNLLFHYEKGQEQIQILNQSSANQEKIIGYIEKK